MARQLHMLGALGALALMVGTLTLVRPAAAKPPNPQPLPNPGDCVAAQIYYGAVPPGGRRATVLVFVHGLAGLAEDWWTDQTSAGVNDMYLAAYQAGYRTAFVSTNVDREQARDCRVERRPALSVSDSGAVLSRQIALIAKQYNVAQVDVVAHSKGGIDAQSAIVQWGAWRYVRHLFTLSSPHQGSILADALWSPDGFWLSVILGQRDAASYSLRTDQMALFRSLADQSQLDNRVRYYSAAGNFWQTPDSIYELTGEWLQGQPDGGPNDGVVTVASTAFSGATTLFVQPWNHAEITLGRHAFPYIDAVLRAPPLPTPTRAPSPSIYLPLLANSAGARAAPAASTTILRGGRLDGGAAVELPIEPFARAARFTLVTSGALRATLHRPDNGSTTISLRQYEANPLLSGAQVGAALVVEPAAGTWRLQLEGEPGAAYLLLAEIDSPLQITLDSSGQQFEAASTGPGDPVVRELVLQALPDRVAGPAEPLTLRGGPRLDIGAARATPSIASVHVRGETADGHAFERTYIRALP